MSAEKQAILDKYIKFFHEYHDCLHCLNVGCNDRGKNDRRCCFEGNNLCVSWIENLAQEISALYINETGQQATNTASQKFPSSTDVWNSVIDHYMDVGLPGTVEQARSVSKVVYDFLRRKLLA